MKRRSLLIAAAGLFTGACDREMSREEAKDHYAKIKPKVDAFATDLHARVAALPRFSTKRQGAHTDWLDKVLGAERVFHDEAMVDLLEKHRHLVGLELVHWDAKVTQRTPENAQLLGTIGNSGPNFRDAVAPKDGERADGRMLGWGMGQTGVNFGDGDAYTPDKPLAMIKLTWEHKLATATLGVQAAFLTEQESDPKWRALLKKRRGKKN